jgi:hypothetical protein
VCGGRHNVAIEFYKKRTLQYILKNITKLQTLIPKTHSSLQPTRTKQHETVMFRKHFYFCYITPLFYYIVMISMG